MRRSVRTTDGSPSALLEYVPPDYAASVAAGTTLTRDVALNALASQLLGARDVGVDALIEAGTRREPFVRLHSLDHDTRTSLLSAVAAASGPLGELVAKILEAGRGSDLVSLGVAARAIYGDGGFEGRESGRKARGVVRRSDDHSDRGSRVGRAL